MTNREYIEAMVKKAKASVDQVENYDQAQTDLMCKVAAKVCWDNAKLLGTTAYEETGMGILPCLLFWACSISKVESGRKKS